MNDQSQMSDPKILLVQAQLSPDEGALRVERWYMPLGLLSIATFLKVNGFEQVRVLDADHCSRDDLLRVVAEWRPDVVGVNFNVFSIDLFDEVVAAAKSAGNLVVVGGQAATPIPERLLASNDAIDAVVAYDGEYAMLEIVRRVARGDFHLTEIDSVLTRDSCSGLSHLQLASRKRKRRYRVEDIALDSYPGIDRSLGDCDLQTYVSSWNRPDIDPQRRPTSIYFQKGCGKTCTFCARIDKKLRQRSPERIFSEVERLIAAGINYLYVVDDTISADVQFLRSLVRVFERGGGLPVKFWAFADIRDLEMEVVELLHRLRIEKVLVGIETGNELLRRNVGKYFTNDFLFRRLERLASYDIKVEDSYVLGLPGETPETLEDTLRVAKRVAAICHTEGTAFNLMTPLLGSPDWNRMMHVPELKRKYGEGYRFDVGEARRDFLEQFCDLRIGEATEVSLNVAAGTGLSTEVTAGYTP